MLRTLTFLVFKGDRIMGKADVQPAVVCKSPMMQAEHLLYPLFHSSLRNISHKEYGK